MERVNVDGITLEYEVQGSGDPVVLIHGSHIADTFATLMTEPALRDHFNLIRYHRRGFAGSSRANAPLAISTQAADCLSLLQRLGIDRAHIVGHSYGGAIALQLALDAPEAVRSLSLLEPALLDVPSGPQIGEMLGGIVEIYETGDKAGAVDAFLQAVCGKDYRSAVDDAGFEQAVADADTFFGVELPAIGEWTFTREDAVRISQPVLAVMGAESNAVLPGFGEGHQFLLECLPRAKPFVLPRAAHLLQAQNPGDMARALAAFFTENSENR